MKAEEKLIVIWVLETLFEEGLISKKEKKRALTELIYNGKTSTQEVKSAA